ncbi:G2/M phase-specific E3 ubiquitin-protein ligase-like isoform X2 [Acanthochromis polyacanthus]|uniref:G2/M phase-specific E3 ubiquitin-protein ligase-like isoform X2 n=1 Tax=Acanthochromis polyacanthus TaxID=80966 RepID=UPI0022349307|nr:G2/M phase-specific E3 ubiquitin-protein ligase-like isoform X2 [Acanthochromis polyacanthus]
MQSIRTAFQPVVEGCRLQILLPCHFKLVEPSLSPTQTLNGKLVKKLFHQKSIFVRPDKVILSEDKETLLSDEERSHTNSCADIPSTDQCGIEGALDISKGLVSTISTAEAQPLSNISSFADGDEVIWCVASSNSSDNLAMSTSATVATIDDSVLLSSGTSAISSDNTHGSLLQPSVSVSEDSADSSANNASIQCRGPTCPSGSGNRSSSTPYSTYLDLFEEEYLSDDPDLQEAISRSLESSTSESDLKMTLERLMEQIASRVNDDNTVRFNIMRRNVWDGASRAMGRSNFSPEKRIDVKFTDDYGTSEGAVDNGGPTREFFRLCLHEIKDKIGIFEGLSNAKVLTCNSKAMKENGYFYAGQIMAMSIAHGGQSPCFLSEVLYECLPKGPDDVKVKTDDIADEETRSQVQRILQAETESQLQDAVTQAANLISMAGHNVRITLENKQETALDLAHWFRDGLTALGVLEAVQRYPLQMKCLFVSGEKALTATDIESLFQIIHSERGSNAFQEECRTMTFWQDYLQDAEFEEGVSLEDILVFFTGCDSIPALGFSPKPSLEFINHSRFPVANTCDNILRIPLHASYTAFKHDMDFAIRNSPGFGRA